MVDFFSLFPDVKAQNYYNRNLPTAIGGGSIGPFQNRPLLQNTNRGRSLLDNIYGLSTNPSIQANPPSRFRTNMMGGYNLNSNVGQGKQRTFTNRDMSQFVDPNINDPLLRNFPEQRETINNIYSKIPKDQRKYVKVQDGQVFFEYPEELEMGTQDQTEKVPSNIPQYNTEEEYLKASGLLNQQGNKTNKKGLLNISEEEVNEQKPKMTMQGLLDKAVQFATSDFGRDFFMNIDDDYSTTPKSFLSRVTDGYNVAKANEREREKLDIERTKANKLGGDSRFAYIVKDPNTGKIYNAYDTKKGIVVDVNGTKQPFRNDMFEGEKSATISNVGNINDQDITPNKMLSLSKDITTTENQLLNLSRYMENTDNSYMGMEKLAVQFKTMMKSIISDYGNLSPSELNQAILGGQFDGLIGQNRLEIVGGGVMTEPDALKIMSALGGDPDKIDTNPMIAIEQMSNIFAQKYRTYENELEMYNINAQAGGFSNYPKKEKLTFNDNFLGVISPSKLLELDLAKIPEFTENQLFRLLRNNTDINGNVIEERFDSVQISQIIELAKSLGIDIKLEDGEIVTGDGDDSVTDSVPNPTRSSVMGTRSSIMGNRGL